MALLLRVLMAALGSGARALGLFAGLFGAYLLWSQALPAYRATTHLAAQRPQLQQLVEQLETDLAKRKASSEQLTERLATLSREQFLQLEQQVSDLQATLNDRTDQVQRLADELSTALAEEEKYCRTWNPLKRWMCREVELRTRRTRQVVEPLLHSAKDSEQQTRKQLEEAKRAFAQLDTDAALKRVQGSEALMLQAALAEQTSVALRIEKSLAQTRRQLTLATTAELSPWAWLQRELYNVGPSLFFMVVLVLLVPWLQRVVAYFVFMPLVQHAKLLRLLDVAEGLVETDTAKRSLRLTIEPGQKCWARADYVRPVEGRTRSQWLLDWRAPLVSYASGLSILTRIEVPSESSRAVTTTLASPRHSDSYLAEVRLRDAPGFVFHPRHLVAVSGNVELWTVWRVRSLHAWATGQLRYIGVRGTGCCVFEGFGDLVTSRVNSSRQRIERELVVGFDARLEYGTARTETFLPYLLGRTPLVDDVFAGCGVYLWQKNTRRVEHSFVERTFNVFFGALGKLLGF